MPLISKNTSYGLVWAFIAITIWSGSLVMLRLGMTTSLNAYDLTALRFGVAALILTPVVLRKGIGTSRLGLMSLVGLVAAFGAPYILLISWAMKTAPAAVAGALNPGVMAITAVLMGRLMFGDRIGPAQFTGLFLTITGVILFTLTGDGAELTIGYLILIATGVMWTSYTFIVRHNAIPALNATAIVALGSGIIYLPIYLLALPKQIVTAPLVDVLMQAGFQGVLVSVVAIYAFNRSAELLGASTGAVLPALIPVVTLILSVFVLDEIAGLSEVVSATLVTLGISWILIGKRKATYAKHS